MTWLIAYGILLFILMLMVDFGLGAWAAGIAVLAMVAAFVHWKGTATSGS